RPDARLAAGGSRGSDHRGAGPAAGPGAPPGSLTPRLPGAWDVPQYGQYRHPADDAGLRQGSAGRYRGAVRPVEPAAFFPGPEPAVARRQPLDVAAQSEHLGGPAGRDPGAAP